MGVLFRESLTSSSSHSSCSAPSDAQSAGLQVHHIDQADKVHAAFVEAVPAAALGVFPVASQISLAVVIQHVVFAGHEKHIFRAGDFQYLVDVSNSAGLERWLMSPVCRMNSGGDGQRVDLVDRRLQRRRDIGLAGLLNPMWLSLICTKLRSPFFLRGVQVR